MDVSVVITCWNGRKLLEKNLPKVLEASKNPKNQISEVIVVDDYSSDDSVEYIESFKDTKTQRCKVRLVRHDRNYGYSKTCNTGVKEAKGDLVAILNLDVVPDKDFLENSIPHFNDKKVFAVSFNEGKFGPGKVIWENGMIGIGPTKTPQKTVLTGWANGGSSVFKKSIWEKLGGMDELFLPFYFEDIDLGIRAYKAGFECLFEVGSKVKHEHEATINSDNFKTKYIQKIKDRNHLLLTWKNIDSFKLFLSHIIFLLKKCFLHPGYFKIVFMALGRILFINPKSKLKTEISTSEYLKISESIKTE